MEMPSPVDSLATWRRYRGSLVKDASDWILADMKVRVLEARSERLVRERFLEIIGCLFPGLRRDLESDNLEMLVYYEDRFDKVDDTLQNREVVQILEDCIWPVGDARAILVRTVV